MLQQESVNIAQLREIIPRLSSTPCGPKATWDLPEGKSEAWAVWTDGAAVSVTKARLAPFARFPIHVHMEDEHIVVYGGEMLLHYVEGYEERIITEGEGVYIPRGVAHAVENPGEEPLFLVVIHVPAGEGLPHGEI